MILIADSGSTKTTWALLKEDQTSKLYSTSGINAFFQTEHELENHLRKELIPRIGITEIQEIHFYGAGCTTDKQKTMVKNAFSKVFKFEKIEVESDLLEAARALCGDEPGIACILGTGSNSCYYDGHEISKSVSPLGFIIGDEGGGVSLGRKLVADCLKNQISAPIKERFFKRFNLSEAQIMENIYNKPFPNRFLGSLSIFLKENLAEPEIYKIVYEGFSDFFKRNVFQYDYKNTLVHVVGSIGFYYQDVLRQVATDLSVNLGKVIQAPMDDLILYYTGKKSALKPNMTFKKITEMSSLHDNLENSSVLELLTGINEEDHKVAFAVEKVIPSLEKLVEGIVERMKRGGRIFYMGAGTSGRLGVLDASEIPPTYGMPKNLVIGLIAGGDTALRNSVEAAEDNQEKGWEELQSYKINQNDTVIGIAASGTTPYVIGALKKCQENGILTGSITCNPNAPVSKYANIPIEAIVGPEFVTGSTRMKSGTAQKMILNMITTSTMIKLGRVKGNRMVNMQLTNKKLIDRGTKMIMEETSLDYETAQNLLLLHGSVKKAVDAYNFKKQ